MAKDTACQSQRGAAVRSRPGPTWASCVLPQERDRERFVRARPFLLSGGFGWASDCGRAPGPKNLPGLPLRPRVETPHPPVKCPRLPLGGLAWVHHPLCSSCPHTLQTSSPAPGPLCPLLPPAGVTPPSLASHSTSLSNTLGILFPFTLPPCGSGDPRVLYSLLNSAAPSLSSLRSCR